MFDPRQIISRLISAYYKEATDLYPRHIDQREFGFGTFDAKVAGRHMAFDDEKKFTNYLTTAAPLYVSCSQAYYRFPAARPMEAKILLGAEMVFDIDATDMNLPCQKEHGKKWVCPICLESVKAETTKLIEEFLIPDFGFSEKEIEINFSGNRGYHLHINSKSVMDLDSYARREISEYIAGSGLDKDDFFKKVPEKELLKQDRDSIPTYSIGPRPEGAATNQKILVGPETNDKGWKGKIANNFIKALDEGVPSLTKLNITQKMAQKLVHNKILIKAGIDNGNWDVVPISNKDELWKTVVARQAILQGDKIDKNVTADPTHLLRLPNTIHGDTGLLSRKVGTKSSLEKFEPMKESIAFKKGEAKVHITNSPQLSINGETYGPYADEDVILPIYAAAYLHLKGVGAIKGYRPSSK